ncbi:hypothetical protein REPUB_Repub03eG0176500 [Reevesia pubescens]
MSSSRVIGGAFLVLLFVDSAFAARSFKAVVAALVAMFLATIQGTEVALAMVQGTKVVGMMITHHKLIKDEYSI